MLDVSYIARIPACSLSALVLALGCSDQSARAPGSGADGVETGLTTFEHDDESGGDEAESAKGDDDDSIKLDLEDNDTPAPGNACPDGQGGGGGGGMPGDSYSYIWISNSPAGTVSKINTETGIEEGRYLAGPGTPDPSRTSVNLLGDAVVVDRAGGIAKIAVLEERCRDLNNNGIIDTSQGPNDVRPWGSDECVLWHVPLPSGGQVLNQWGPRPVAWEGIGPEDCTKPRVWVGWRDQTMGHFRRLNGETGEVEGSASVPWPGSQWGPYGGATNKEGDFWVLGWQVGPLVRINGDNLVPKVYQIPQPPNDTQWTYGMALDADGHPWIVGSATVYHFNPDTEQWDFITVPGANMRGLMVDAEGRAWIANNGFTGSRLVEVDTITKTLANPSVPLPGAQTPVGISIDSEGKVWVVDQDASVAFKVDPDTYQTLLTVSGLISPYTYSDMTGAGLGLVTFPPPK